MKFTVFWWAFETDTSPFSAQEMFKDILLSRSTHSSGNGIGVLMIVAKMMQNKFWYTYVTPFHKNIRKYKSFLTSKKFIHIEYKMISNYS